jgi:uncharacterized protein YodC (DUF2158 family)
MKARKAGAQASEGKGMTFKIGDKVRLKAGGALMTVEGLDPAGIRVDCVWHERAKGKVAPRRATYHKDALERSVVGAIGFQF